MKLFNSKNSSETRFQEFLTIKETCEYLAVSRQTLNRWERQHLLIPCRIGTQVRYSVNDIINTLNASRYARA